ncbi:MAG: lysoplasmalogenase [Clostridia bacterium]|nr:lysoplasmalogenase [Clostridia bacterium]
MKKTFKILNVVAVFAAALAYILYRGGTVSKGVASFGFVLIGVLNLIYAVLQGTIGRKFPVLMTLGFAFCMVGDVAIDRNFIVGAALFALGHIFYCIAYCSLSKFKAKDLVPIALFFTASTLLITLVPIFDFGAPLMEGICLVYALIISCMVGKSVTNCLQSRNAARILLAIGSILFYFSDLMLVFDTFGGISAAGPLCLGTYYPAQCLLAVSVYCYVNVEKQ